MSRHKASLGSLFAVIVLDLIGFGVVIPILPFFAEAYGASATMLGLILTSYAAMQFLFSPLWGRLSDKIGRKKVLLMTMAGSVIGMVILGLAPNLWVLFLGRILSGVFGANISVATAYVTDVTSEANRAKGMGLIGAAFGIGFILGPALGGSLSVYGYSVPLLTAAGLSFLNIFFAWWSLGESRPEGDGKRMRPFQVLADSEIFKMCALYLLYTIAITQLEATFAFLMMDRFNYDAQNVAYILVLMALIMVGVQGGLIRRLAPKYGERKLLLVGVVLLGAAFLFVPGSPTVKFILIPLCVASLGRGISQPSFLSLTSQLAEKSSRGAVMGVFQSSASLGRVLGPISAGALYDWHLPYPYYFAGLLLLIVFLWGLTLAKPLPTNLLLEGEN